MLNVASIPLLICVVFLVGVGSCFFDPAAQAAIPLVVGRDERALSRANGKLWAVDTFGRGLAGPPLGAVFFGLAVSLPFGVEAVPSPCQLPSSWACPTTTGLPAESEHP